MFDRFVVWTEAGLLGRAPSEAEALNLAHRQTPGRTVYVRDAFAGDCAFAIVAGDPARRPLPAHLFAPDGPLAPSEQAPGPFRPSDYSE